MHGTLLYPVPAGQRLASHSPLRGLPRIPKLTPHLRKRIAAWKRILLTELLRRTQMRVR
jgi:hypothetical protein